MFQPPSETPNETADHDDRLLVRIFTVTAALQAELLRPPFATDAPPGGEDGAQADPKAPLTGDALVKEMTEVMAEIQQRLPLVHLTDEERATLHAEAARRPAPQMILDQSADLADLADLLQKLAPGECEVTGDAIREAARAAERLDRFKAAMDPMLGALGQLQQKTEQDLLAICEWVQKSASDNPELAAALLPGSSPSGPRRTSGPRRPRTPG